MVIGWEWIRNLGSEYISHEVLSQAGAHPEAERIQHVLDQKLKTFRKQQRFDCGEESCKMVALSKAEVACFTVESPEPIGEFISLALTCYIFTTPRISWE